MSMMDFGKVRNWKGAILFYFVYLLVAMLLGFLFGGLAGAMTSMNSFEAGQRAGVVVGTLLTIALGYLILYEKKQLRNFGYWFLVCSGGILALLGGGLLGLIPISFLTTRKKKT